MSRFFSALSGIFLILCFPGFSFGFLAWISLIPLLISIRRAESPGQAVTAGLISGGIFFIVSLQWLTYVTAFGWIFLAALETAFFVLFCRLAYEAKNIRNVFLRVLWISLAWLIMEFFRSEVPIFSFGWNLLAYSQSDYRWVTQSANTVGAYGLGFIIAFVNASAAEIFLDVNKERKFSSANLVPFALLSFVFILLISHGFYHLKKPNPPTGQLRVSLIQGNIPQDIKWEVVAREKIIEIYSKLTELAGYDQPDLIIWPEAAFPGYFNHDLERGRIQELIKKAGAPTLIGSPHFVPPDAAFNSAYLVGSDGLIKERYDKQYLVPFGEYVPLKPLFGWLEPLAYSLGVSDFSAGHESTVFHLMNGEISFSTLICFEDTFPSLARKFVERGADFLAVITNDAWFGDSAAPYQHLQASVFRAVENGVPLVRAANTGVSAFISSRGEVLGRVSDEKTGKDIFVTGKKTLNLPMDKHPTLYRKIGWIFPYAGLGVFVIMAFIKKRIL